MEMAGTVLRLPPGGKCKLSNIYTRRCSGMICILGSNFSPPFLILEREEYHLSVEPRKIFPPYISSTYRWNGNRYRSDTCFAGIYFDPLFTFSPLDLPRLMYPRVFFSPVYRIYRDVLAIKSKRRILAKFQQIIFYFRRKRGKQKKA